VTINRKFRLPTGLLVLTAGTGWNRLEGKALMHALARTGA
jgi:hypothetical protein